ncbi:GNAT family N-acetyltransferase [Streptomyces sanyensis]|uniref:GNAT family N-acetyltransferase n=1 Tax=Streptomyces sanyensis TaxID=568869 RepID=UPI003D77D8A8
MQGRFISLRPPTTDDFDLIAAWLAPDSPGTALSGDAREMASPEEIRAAHYSGSLSFRVIYDNTGDALGFVNWRRRGSHQSFEIAVIVGEPDRWRSAFGGEAVIRLVDILFMTYDARRVQLTTGAFNAYTLPALVRGGFVLEGVLRDFYYVDGRYHDATVWSMLRSEYEAELKRSEHLDGLKYVPSVPEADKERARRMLHAYLAEGGPTSLDADRSRTGRGTAATAGSAAAAGGGDRDA